MCGVHEFPSTSIAKVDVRGKVELNQEFEGLTGAF